MCYHIAYFTQDAEDYEERFNASIVDGEVLPPVYHTNGFAHAPIPVITNEDPYHIRFYDWGLIPHWAKDPIGAAAISKKTLNARGETIFEKPSFRDAAKNRRCLVLVDGFYEYRHFEGKKYPYFISLKEGPFAFAGLWSCWDFEGRTRNTVSIVTTDANPLMAKIHNTKKRMPAILPKGLEREWLMHFDGSAMGKKELLELIKPFDGNEMLAHTVRPLVGKAASGNSKVAMEPYGYEGLPEL